ncbi:hypothetical protein ACFCWY_30475 [Streptomyces sp. NPDC056362]|uniref:hypothetical protein n=1 Tax=unclassified Streptomyces TaxID=2593676 RepID=UPI0035DF5971
MCAAVLLGGCSSSEPDGTRAQWQDYCARLGAWQEARNSVDALREAPGGAEALAQAVMSAASVLDRTRRDQDSVHVIGDTASAVTEADLVAEGRVVSSCDRAGLGTLVR